MPPAPLGQVPFGAQGDWLQSAGLPPAEEIVHISYD
jgi:hypothetical protein